MQYQDYYEVGQTSVICEIFKNNYKNSKNIQES